MTTVLERTLSQVRATIHRARMSQLLSDRLSLVDVDSVRCQLVDPILGALGWNVDDTAEVNAAFQLDGISGRSGIALFLAGAPSMLIELRGMRQEINQKRLFEQLLPGASQVGFEWLLLTDGDLYEVFCAQAGLPAEHRPFDAIRISDDSTPETIGFFDLFAKRRAVENRLESAWNRRVIDRKVQRAFEELLASDDALVQLLLSRTEDLSTADIRSSLARAKLVLEFEARTHSQCRCLTDLQNKAGRAFKMSEAELRVATWLQRRSIERWAKGGVAPVRSRTAQRRGQERRRKNRDRRSGCEDRRAVCIESGVERRSAGERRSCERRRDLERRMKDDRRRERRRA